MRNAVSKLTRCIGTIATGEFRVFVWLNRDLLPDHQLYVFAREDDYFFGVIGTPVLMKCGHAHWEHSFEKKKAGFVTHPRPHLRHSRSRGHLA